MSKRRKEKISAAARDASAADEQALLSSSILTVLNDAGKGTPEMRAALQEMQQLLACPLCHCIFSDPVTLTCGHCFCRACIDAANCNSWQCPGTFFQ